MQKNDLLSRRLGQILTMLNDGKRFNIEELAEEFNVTTRTIQRDINRLSYLPIEKKDGYYHLEAYCLGKLSYKDIHQFATFSGIQELYPELNNSFIVDILNSKINETMEIKGYNYEDLSKKADEFNLLAMSIVTRAIIKFIYHKEPRQVNPYKLINTNGIWYLVGVENNILKHFSFSKIQKLEVLQKNFSIDKAIKATLEENNGVWFTQNKIQAEIEVSSTVSEYFLRRDLLPGQKLVKQTETGLIFSVEFAYNEEIFRIIRYWIPHLTIHSPKYLQKKLEESLKKYLHL